MEMRVLPLSSSQNYLPPSLASKNRSNSFFKPNFNSPNLVKVYASKEGTENGSAKGEPKQSLFTNLTDALDFAQVRSEKDAELLYEAREATKAGGRMTKDQVIMILIIIVFSSCILYLHFVLLCFIKKCSDFSFSFFIVIVVFIVWST